MTPASADLQPLVAKVLVAHLGRACLPEAEFATLASELAYALDIARAWPLDFTYGGDHRELAGAVRTLLRLLPGMITEAERLGREAIAASRPTDLVAAAGGRSFVTCAQALLDAAEPFRAITKPRGLRGAWHGFARWLLLSIQPALLRAGRPRLRFHNSDGGRGGRLIAELLGLAGREEFESATPTAVAKELMERDEQS